MDSVATQYVKTEAGYIAYRTFGQGPLDILFLTNWSTNLEVMREWMARYRRLAMTQWPDT